MMHLPKLLQKINLRPSSRLPSSYLVLCRKCSVGKQIEHNEKLNPIGEGYTTVYKFPLIRLISAFSRLKVYHTAGTLISVPVSMILATQGFLDPMLPVAITLMGFGVGAFLFSLGTITNRCVGFIYFNETKELVKVAYVDFWGRRKDEEIPLGDIIPLSEIKMNSISQQIYKPIKRYSERKTFKVSSNYGMILDEGKYNKIFALEIKQ